MSEPQQPDFMRFLNRNIRAALERTEYARAHAPKCADCDDLGQLIIVPTQMDPDLRMMIGERSEGKILDDHLCPAGNIYIMECHCQMWLNG